ncbi:MAG TPA: hypothetical protein PKJ19_08735 [Flavobacteriales bacterium]|nr:hypothetical protein [Flavobacteriales bacterium]
MRTHHQPIEHLSAYEREYLAWYEREQDTVGEPFDTQPFVDAALAQYPGQPELAAAFARRTGAWHRSRLYTYLRMPADRKARWHFIGSFWLQHPDLGKLLVDLLKDPDDAAQACIGGFEYFDRLGEVDACAAWESEALKVLAELEEEKKLNAELRADLQAIEELHAAQLGQPFEPGELLQLATEQWPDMPLVAATFALCTQEWPESDLYTHFMGYPERCALPYTSGATLMHPELGELLVDLAFDERVEGGVRVMGMDYLDRVFTPQDMDKPTEVYWPERDALPTSTAPPQGQLRIVHVKGTLPGAAAYTASPDGELP